MRRAERGALPLAMIVGATVLAIAGAGLLGVVLPASDAAVGSEAPGDARKYTRQQVDGRKIYVREGCFTCHTQAVRDTAADMPLGRISAAGLYLNEAPNLIGLDRVGPDLTCAGERMKSRSTTVKFLKRPDSVHKGSAMPRYGFLTAAELNALAAYITGLTCQGAER